MLVSTGATAVISRDADDVAEKELQRRRDEIEWNRTPKPCAEADPGIFFMVTNGDDDDDDDDEVEEPPYPHPEARRICNACPVRALCLARHLKEPAGTFAGMSAYQRRQIDAQRKVTRPRCPGCESTSVVSENGNQVCLSCGVSWFGGA